MTWPHPFVTIDQNYLRRPALVSDALDTSSRHGLRVLVPDGSFLEFAKGGHFSDTARLSLQLLAPYREIVVAGRKLACF